MRSTTSSIGPGIGANPSAASQRSGLGMRESVAAIRTARRVRLRNRSMRLRVYESRAPPTISTDVGCVWAAKLFCVRARCEDPGRTPVRRRDCREPSIASSCAASRSRSGPAMLCSPPRRLWKIRVSALVARRGARNACARWQSRADFSPSEGVGEWRCGMYGVLVAWMASSVFQSSRTLSTPRGSMG